jgi:hypothetical protein
MKETFKVRVTADGSVDGIYHDGIAETLGAKVTTVKRASHVEFEEVSSEVGWTVRSALESGLAIRLVIKDGAFRQVVAYEGQIAVFTSREAALEAEVRFFWELLGWEKSPCPTHQQVGCMTCRYGEPPAACPVNCQGIDLGDGNWSGCSCREGKLANGQPWPEGWQCDCPQHTGPNPCKEVPLG